MTQNMSRDDITANQFQVWRLNRNLKIAVRGSGQAEGLLTVHDFHELQLCLPYWASSCCLEASAMVFLPGWGGILKYFTECFMIHMGVATHTERTADLEQFAQFWLTSTLFSYQLWCWLSQDLWCWLPQNWTSIKMLMPGNYFKTRHSSLVLRIKFKDSL